MNRNPIQLWIAYPDDLLNYSTASQCMAILNNEDCAHWQSFRFDRHRREALASRALVRNALSHARPVLPQEWHFDRPKYGKPTVLPNCGLCFNASNSVGLVVCLVAESTEVGIDVEPLTRAEEILGLAPEVFSAEEQAQLDVLPFEKRLDRALSLWTLKEAYIKARGLGLEIPLHQFSFLFGSDREICLQISDAMRDTENHWNFFLLDCAGHRIASLVERPQTHEVQVFEARPAIAQPVLLSGYEVNWYPVDSRTPGLVRWERRPTQPRA